MDTIAPVPFRQNRTLQALALIYAAFWAAMAYKPVYPYDWWVENILILVTVPAVVITYRWFQFSDTSYVFLTIFLMLHTYSAHYAYTQVPLPWLNDLFGRPDRMNFDRVVHLSYGLLLAYPIRELLQRVIGVRRGWASFLSATVILASGALYELMEMLVAVVLAPDVGDAFVGTQGDIWDAQKDMALALYGAVFALAVAALVRHWRRGPVRMHGG